MLASGIEAFRQLARQYLCRGFYRIYRSHMRSVVNSTKPGALLSKQ